MNKTIGKLKALQESLTAEKRPRHYAADICQLKTKAERRAALAKVPEEMRGMVEEHVKNEFEKRKYRNLEDT